MSELSKLVELFGDVTVLADVLSISVNDEGLVRIQVTEDLFRTDPCITKKTATPRKWTKEWPWEISCTIGKVTVFYLARTEDGDSDDTAH